MSEHAFEDRIEPKPKPITNPEENDNGVLYIMPLRKPGHISFIAGMGLSLSIASIRLILL